mmetsp:Transcript_833/g.1902  ORF Transcript_833/g.1902 Transcript_833/m.1902 type:complete len:102 (+) Transcript_833:174-479(+)|eukprot:CAMPEP_0172525736 /NCGR_PEP_ID=MMETSP1067-20121228/755_1 /TAXON_ID=265564 ORGANISM="Thalassiosira punctigera, Strain Tpunct2005C2" /NCGR_SAMPLE_ID=MMETSP1067 /ASSEMBLY_ACC=CAM_ASM_000444 /LENGTH=101 /DNA_ID=CAMNT_0013309071 /DNA_START=155 /DNA_END=460 /DNA_ORIENTATION=-
MCSDIGTTSRVCAGYSFTGILFTLFVGVLLSTQPEFITGIEDVSEAKSNAFGAMGMFIATFSLSVLGILRTSPNEKEDIDTDNGYQLSSVGQSEYGSSRYD